MQSRILRLGFYGLSYGRPNLIFGTRLNSAFAKSPSPPLLPKEEQEIFEQLQRTKSSNHNDTASAASNMAKIDHQKDETLNSVSTATASTSSQDRLHPDIRKGAPPEFDGETNPKTGEIGGPKNEPLRWGSAGDWSYNGRVSDF